MSDNDVVKNTEPVKQDATKAEVKTDTSIESNVPKYDEIFITEKDTFDIAIRFYRKQDALIVESVDDSFEPQESSIKSFNVTFKYPDQGDSTKIQSGAAKISADAESLDIKDLLNLEFSRLLCLIRKWDLGKELSNRSILSMNPKIVRAMVIALRNKIGMEGII